MLNVKLIVIFVLIDFGGTEADYCGICPNHTLCKYKIPGPSTNCQGYDSSAQLTRDDIIAIVNRINEKRNYIARGLSEYLPPAANMRKISWSRELSRYAQRWADQCDPSVRPDKEDQCRDLSKAGTGVGQNIATIFGPTPGLHVKSFVDIWFMQILDYTGSVAFYNQSEHLKTDHLTQLIWAETDSVGCGKARFYLEHRNIMVERLVCNFAPKGNVHGKPVYAMGFPATQCPDYLLPDRKFPALCSHQSQRRDRSITPKNFPVTSLLRIINLSNNSVKQEIDPIKNILKSNGPEDGTSDRRHQKLRHVPNSDELLQFLPRPIQWNNFNESRYTAHQHQQEKGHSRVYHSHSHDLKDNSFGYFTTHGVNNFRRYDFTTQIPNYKDDRYNIRRMNYLGQCTRRLFENNVRSGCNAAVPCCSNDCTKGNQKGCHLTPPWFLNCAPNRLLQYPFTLPTCSPIPRYTKCHDVTFHCACSHINHQTNACPYIRQQGQSDVSNDDTRRNAELHYYDLLPNMAVRNGGSDSHKLSSNRLSWLSKGTTSEEENRREYNEQSEDMTNEFVYPKFNDEISNERQKRESEKNIDTSKPFWNARISEDQKLPNIFVKSIRYTTLFNRKMKKSWTTTPSNPTEPITITVRNIEDKESNEGFSTEKYLSFEELMRLRKINMGDSNARRIAVLRKATAKPKVAPKGTTKAIPKGTTKAIPKGTTKAAPKETTKAAPKETIKAPKKLNALRSESATTTTQTPPENYTMNTQYKRKKHCTRKLTCTWTIYSVTAIDGSIISMQPGGGGSKTPPGYVEGCTRTSTCTRDFMNRNKISTIPTFGDESQTVEDEDYCERRELNVQRRNSDDTELKHDRIAIEISTLNNENIATRQAIANSVISSKVDDYCDCDENSRLRRAVDHNHDYYRTSQNELSSHKKENGGKNRNPSMSYGDLYYLVLKKLVQTSDDKKASHSKKCPCNANSISERNNVIIVFVYSLVYVYML